jgi:hypothetical protein
MSEILSINNLDLYANSVYNHLADTELKPQLEEIFTILKSKVGYNKRVWYGDMDVYLHVEDKGTDIFSGHIEMLFINDVVVGEDLCILAVTLKNGEVFNATFFDDFEGPVKSYYGKTKGFVFEKGLNGKYDKDWDRNYSGRSGFSDEYFRFALNQTSWAHEHITEGRYVLEE